MASSGGGWYTKCIKSSNLVLLSDVVYVELLCFIVDNGKKLSNHIKTLPLIKYTSIAKETWHCVQLPKPKQRHRRFDMLWICRRIPVIYGADHVRMQRTVTLVPALDSKWMKLFGPQNPFVEQNYVDIGFILKVVCFWENLRLRRSFFILLASIVKL